MSNNSGFTLIELIVTVAIIGMLAAVTLVGGRGGDQRATLHLETQKFVGDIRRAQNMALGALDFNGVIPAGGWGIYIVDAATYYLFVDNDVLGSANHGRYTAGDSIAETVTLSPKVIFSVGIGTSVVFVPPDPAVYINGALGGSAIVTLRLALVEYPSVTRDVTLNGFGLVDVSQ